MKKKIAVIALLALLACGQANATVEMSYDLSNIPIYPYVEVDGNPVGPETKPDRYIERWNLPGSVERYFLERANGDSHVESFKAYISKEDNKNVPQDGKHFSRFYAMSYGKKGKMVWNVLVKFGIIRPAIYWYIDYGGVRYYLVRDDKCYNWSFYCDLAPVTKPVVEKEEVLIAYDPATVLPGEGEGALIPAVTEEVTTEEEPSWFDNLNPDWDSWVGAGIEIGLNNDDIGYYYTGFISFFPHIFSTDEADVYLGPSFQHTGWGGSTGDVTYNGYFNFYGGDLRYKMAQQEYQLKAYYGEKYGTVDGDGIPYYASVQSTIFALEGACLWWYEEGQDEFGFRFEFDLGGSKYSTWEGNPILGDPRDDETMYYVRYKHTRNKQEGDLIPFTKTAQVSSSYVEADHSYRAGIDLGGKFYNDDIEPTVGVRHNFKNKKWSGVGAVQVHASDIAKNIWDMITSDPVENEQ